MYSEVITYAANTFADNRRVLAQSMDLRAQTNALLLTYRAHRFHELFGASDAGDQPRVTRRDHPQLSIWSKVRSGLLPLPADAPEKCWVGKGTRRPCDGCDEVITAEEVEYEVDIADGGTLRFHSQCLGVWHALRAERMTD